MCCCFLMNLMNPGKCCITHLWNPMVKMLLLISGIKYQKIVVKELTFYI